MILIEFSLPVAIYGLFNIDHIPKRTEVIVWEQFVTFRTTCHKELFKTGTEGNQAKNAFDDYLACLVYDSTFGVVPYGKFLPFQSYHIVFDCCPFLASTTTLQLVSINYFYCFSFSSFSLFILILSSLNKNSHRPILILSCSFGRSRSRREARRLGKRSPTTFIHPLESARKKRHLFGSVGLLGMAEIRARANVHWIFVMLKHFSFSSISRRKRKDLIVGDRLNNRVQDRHFL